MDADALSTAAFVLGLEEGMKLVNSLKGVEAIFITGDKRVYVTEGLKSSFTFDDESKEFKYAEKG
jgi:thiamine biosynthesis lipoprotein